VYLTPFRHVFICYFSWKQTTVEPQTAVLQTDVKRSIVQRSIVPNENYHT